MPRKSRINGPGPLHHIICRGIDHQTIFQDDRDQEKFIERLSGIVTDTDTFCLAWALIPNHAHLVFRSGPSGLPTLMRRLLTGYAVTFNHRHNRHGQLFQNWGHSK